MVVLIAMDWSNRFTFGRVYCHLLHL